MRNLFACKTCKLLLSRGASQWRVCKARAWSFTSRGKFSKVSAILSKSAAGKSPLEMRAGHCFVLPVLSLPRIKFSKAAEKKINVLGLRQLSGTLSFLKACTRSSECCCVFRGGTFPAAASAKPLTGSPSYSTLRSRSPSGGTYGILLT